MKNPKTTKKIIHINMIIKTAGQHTCRTIGTFALILSKSSFSCHVVLNILKSPQSLPSQCCFCIKSCTKTNPTNS